MPVEPNFLHSFQIFSFHILESTYLLFVVRIRAIPVGLGARPWLEPIDLFLHDPRGMEISRWTARSAASGPIQVWTTIEIDKGSAIWMTIFFPFRLNTIWLIQLCLANGP